jgi:hypothetical protein
MVTHRRFSGLQIQLPLKVTIDPFTYDDASDAGKTHSPPKPAIVPQRLAFPSDWPE